MTRLRNGAFAGALIGGTFVLLVVLGRGAPAFLIDSAAACRAGATRMARLELLFGMQQAGDIAVRENVWQAFVDTEVTPRFPQGFTVMAGNGQWQGSAGAIAKEPSRILVVWYQTGGESEAHIEAIRGAYKNRFDQESVMRIDSTSCVSF